MTRKKRVLQAVLYLLAMALALGMVGTRFIDPSLTETELFLRYWWLYIPGCVVALLLAFAAARLGE